MNSKTPHSEVPHVLDVAGEYFYLPDQLLAVFAVWHVTEPLPRKGQKVIVAFAPGREVRLAEITRSAQKSTSGAPLYRVVLSR